MSGKYKKPNKLTQTLREATRDQVKYNPVKHQVDKLKPTRNTVTTRLDDPTNVNEMLVFLSKEVNRANNLRSCISRLSQSLVGNILLDKDSASGPSTEPDTLSSLLVDLREALDSIHFYILHLEGNTNMNVEINTEVDFD